MYGMNMLARALAYSGKESFEQQRALEGRGRLGQHRNPVEEPCPKVLR